MLQKTIPFIQLNVPNSQESFDARPTAYIRWCIQNWCRLRRRAREWDSSVCRYVTRFMCFVSHILIKIDVIYCSPLIIWHKEPKVLFSGLQVIEFSNHYFFCYRFVLIQLMWIESTEIGWTAWDITILTNGVSAAK